MMSWTRGAAAMASHAGGPLFTPHASGTAAQASMHERTEIGQRLTVLSHLCVTLEHFFGAKTIPQDRT